MNSSGTSENRKTAWLRWILFSEGLILLLAIAGPGYRHALRPQGDRALIARWFLEDPSFLGAVIVNVLALHLFIAGVWIAARIVTRSRQRRSRRLELKRK